MSADTQIRPTLAVAATAFKALGHSALRDGPGLVGLVMISVGAGQVYAPAGLIVGGLFLVGGAFLAGRARVESAKAGASEPKP